MTTLFLHVIIALTSLSFSGYVFFYPSASKLRISYALVTGTLLTGSYLLASAPSHMLEGCVMGFFYVSLVTLATVYAHRRLAAAKAND
jgi:hypothetical protein